MNSASETTAPESPPVDDFAPAIATNESDVSYADDAVAPESMLSEVSDPIIATNESAVSSAGDSAVSGSELSEVSAPAIAANESAVSSAGDSASPELAEIVVPAYSVAGVDSGKIEGVTEGIESASGLEAAASPGGGVSPGAADGLNEQTVATGPPESPPVDPCKQYDAQYDSWLDRNQVRVYRTVCGTAAWFDGFFGDNRYDQETGETYGRISLGGYWDQLNGVDPQLRFSARFALPSLRQRGSLLIGRGDEQNLIEERTTSSGDPNPITPQENQDVSTFVGFGYERLKGLTKNFSFRAGLRLRTPPVPILKVIYRRAWQLSERNLLAIRPIVYWRSDEGLGSTVNLDVDHVISDAFLFRWANFGNVSQDEEVEGMNWGSTFYLYQALSNKKALTYSIFARGETDAPVSFNTAGFQVRYRHRILREWLFIEYYGGVDWPRYLPEETREANFGTGLRLEAYFGPAPDSWMR